MSFAQGLVQRKYNSVPRYMPTLGHATMEAYTSIDGTIIIREREKKERENFNTTNKERHFWKKIYSRSSQGIIGEEVARQI